MSVILMTTLFYKQGEIWCWSLLGLKGLNGYPLDMDSSLQSNPVNTDTAGAIECVRNIGISVVSGLDLNPDYFSHVTYLVRWRPMILACARLSIIIIFYPHYSGTKKKWNNTRNYREQNIQFLNQCATAKVLHDSVSPQPQRSFRATFLDPLPSRSWVTLDVSYTLSVPLHASAVLWAGRRYARSMSSITWVTVLIPWILLNYER